MQQGQGVGLDTGGPVGRVGVKGVEESFVDSVKDVLIGCYGKGK